MRKARQYHHDFIAAPDARKFQGGTLRDLFALLAAEVQPMRGTYRVLPSGACVSMAMVDNGLRSVRISRSEHAKACAVTPCSCVQPGSAFHREVETFQRNFGIDVWQVKPDPNARGIALILYEQLPTH